MKIKIFISYVDFREIPKQMMSLSRLFTAKHKDSLNESQGRIAANTIGAYHQVYPGIARELLKRME